MIRFGIIVQHQLKFDTHFVAHTLGEVGEHTFKRTVGDVRRHYVEAEAFYFVQIVGVIAVSVGFVAAAA